MKIVGWQVLDITRAVKMWQKDWRTNEGLYMEVTESTESNENQSSEQIHPHAVGLSSSRNAKPNQEVKLFKRLHP